MTAFWAESSSCLYWARRMSEVDCGDCSLCLVSPDTSIVVSRVTGDGFEQRRISFAFQERCRRCALWQEARSSHSLDEPFDPFAYTSAQEPPSCGGRIQESGHQGGTRDLKQSLCGHSTPPVGFKANSDEEQEPRILSTWGFTVSFSPKVTPRI